MFFIGIPTLTYPLWHAIVKTQAQWEIFMSKITDLAAELRKLLSSGLYPPGARFLSEYEIENRYNISRITANKAVSILVAEGLLERGKRGSGTFVKQPSKFPKGWIAAIENLSTIYNTQVFAGAAQEAYAQGYVLSILRPQASGIADILNNLAKSDCIGIIGFNTLLEMIPANYPKAVIHLDGVLNTPESRNKHSVTCTNRAAAYEMMSHIIAAGKKEIVFLGADYAGNRRERMNGFEAALRDNGFNDAVKRRMSIHSGSPHEIKLTLNKILSQFPDVDFIATDSDEVACRLIKTARARNIPCPGKFGVSGFGNLPDAANYCTIPTVDQHPWHLGVQAVKSLMDVVNNRNSGEIVQIEIPTEVINVEFI